MRPAHVPSPPAPEPYLIAAHPFDAAAATALQELIHEEWGDGIMSAIDFEVDISRHEQDGEDRVRIVLDGKFLPYRW